MTDTQAQEAARLAIASDALADEREMIHLCSWVEIRNLLRADAAILRSQAARISELDEQVKAVHERLRVTEQLAGDYLVQRDALRAELARMREPLSAEALADKCESWLQLGGATNIVDAFEAGYRACEAHGITKTGEQK